MVSESAGQVIETPSQTSCVSQAPADIRQTVPAALGPVAVQTGTPLVQSIWPSSQGLPVSQGRPASQPTMHRPRPEHVPPGQVVPAGSKPSGGQVIDVPSHTSSVSQMSREARQVVPAGWIPAGTQTGDAPLQSTTPISQRLPVLQGAPSTHVVMHMPRPSQVPPPGQSTPVGS